MKMAMGSNQNMYGCL